MEGMDHMIPPNYQRPAPIDSLRAHIYEAFEAADGTMSFRHHHFDARELPIVAQNTERIFFLAQPRLIGGQKLLLTNLDVIL